MLPHIVDPEGDVDLLLPKEVVWPLDSEFEETIPPPSLGYRRPTIQSPPSLENGKKKKKKSKGELAFVTELDFSLPNERLTSNENDATVRNIEENSAVTVLENITSELDEIFVRIRVSSKHLTLASPYFSKSLQGGLTEGNTLRTQRHLELAMKEQDPEAALIVMNIIHGRSRQVPPLISVIMLTKIAVLVDYIQCHEAIEPFSDKWIDNMEENVPKTYCRELVHWICISYVFEKLSIFRAVTQTALLHATRPVELINLPIWDYVSDKFNQHRSRTIHRLLSSLEALLKSLRLDQNECTFECNAIQYGTLAKELGYRGLLFPTPQAPFYGYSFENIASSIRLIQKTSVCDRCVESSYGLLAGNTMPRIENVINTTADTLGRLSPNNFRGDDQG
ncbi:hypothetical protein B0J11DRAFT_582945 [Dendryphion nanum]|uniref:BTB domain-containing protein n=1 Tax=Dendryphion nanum TaxID=256645 RepID=A0A9P9DE13_9PLEO|nr:hypothetical protein B0J11DRAFT_582945 [Dendryphion nanum]